MRLPVIKIMKDMEEANQINMKVMVGYFVKAKVRDTEENTKEGRIRSTRKEVVVCVHYVVGKKRFLVNLKDGQRREIIYCLILYLCSTEEVGKEVSETIYDLPRTRRRIVDY